jgi:hypothetical protein
MHPTLKAMLTQTVTLEAYQGQDSYGVPTYAAAVSLAARVQYRPRRIVTAQGEERTSRARVFLDGAGPAIDLRDRLSLPDGTRPALLTAAPVYDEVGVLDHWEISV